jgi:hypothetical protein
VNRIQHPSRNGDLKSLGNFDDKNFRLAPPKGAHHFNFRPAKRMMPVVDLL